MEAAMLSVPRPRLRGECREEARPCPWVGCRHHLLLTLARPRRLNPEKARATMLVLAGPTETRKTGRRRGLPTNAARVLVEAWIDEAVERLLRLGYTCTLDLVEEKGALDDTAGGAVLGISRQAFAAEANRAEHKFRRLLEAHGVDAETALSSL
jgi:hypothetical protein